MRYQSSKPAPITDTRFFLVILVVPHLMVNQQYQVSTPGEDLTPEIINRKVSRHRFIEARGDKLIIQEVSKEFWCSVAGFSWERE